MMAAMVDQFCDSYRRAPASIMLDIDDTFDAVHGHQQLSLFNAHYDERCFLPIHIYEGASGKPVAMILRAGKTPSGEEVRTILKHVIRRIRGHWPKVRILVRGDSHYGRHEAMEWCENHGVDYIFGFGGNAMLAAMVRTAADTLCVERASRARQKLRRFAALRYGAKSWKRERRSWPASRRPPTVSMSATSSPRSRAAPEHLYETVYCAPRRGRELHQAAQGPTRLRSHLVPRSEGQPVPPDPAHRRLLAHAQPCARPQRQALARAALPSSQRLRLRLIKIAARVVEKAPRASHLTAHRMSRSCPLSPSRRAALRRRTLSDAALSPLPPSSKPPTQKNKIATRRVDTIRRDRGPVPRAQNHPANKQLRYVRVESRMGAVAWAIRQRPVSHPRSSNRTCRFPASGFPTGFTVAAHGGAQCARV